jgi:2-aminobenzoate-CoA ligase
MALAWLAVVKAGLMAVATMPLLRARELGDIIDKAQPTLALCDGKLLDELQQAQAGHPVLATIVPFNQDGVAGSLGARSPAARRNFTACPTAADDIALLAFTSGTTGKPKAVVHTHRDVLAACEAWPRHVLRATPDDIVMGSPPLAFTFGLGGLLLFPMWAGASVYYPDIAYTPEAMVRLIRDVGATICYTAPTFYRQMAPFAESIGLPSLRTCVSAGEGLPDATPAVEGRHRHRDDRRHRRHRDVPHLHLVGRCRRAARGHRESGSRLPGPGGGRQGHEVPRGTVGKLAVIGPTGCRYMDDERQARYVRDGWNFPATPLCRTRTATSSIRRATTT